MVKLEHLHVLMQDTSRWSIICVGKNIRTFWKESYAFLTNAESNDVSVKMLSWGLELILKYLNIFGLFDYGFIYAHITGML